jgi:hypothetical protein
MARYKGKDGFASISGTEIGERISFDLETTVAETDGSVMGDDWTDSEALQLSASGSMDLLFDHGDAGQMLLVAGTTIALELYPTGNTTGHEKISGNFLITSVSRASNVGELVKRTVSIKNKKDVTVGAVV